MTVNRRIARWLDDRKSKHPKSLVRQTNLLYTIELWEMPVPPPEVLIRIDRVATRKANDLPPVTVMTGTARPAIRKGRWTIDWCAHGGAALPEYVKAHTRRLLRDNIDTEDFMRRSWGRGYYFKEGAKRAN